MDALQLFRSGNDYLEIGQILSMTEAEVEIRIHELRRMEQEGCRPAEVYVKPPPYRQPLIAYAGKER